MRPWCWARWVRRAFALTLPLSIVLWLGLAILLTAIAAGRALWRPISDFWNAPRRVRYGYRFYGHSSLRHSSRRRSDLRVETIAAAAADQENLPSAQ